MAGWSDVGVVAVSGAIGVGGTVAATWLQRRYARDDRQTAERAARIERVGRVLGRIQTLLIDLHPIRASNRVLREVLSDRHDRWLPLRDELAIVTVMEPSAPLRDQMNRLEVVIELLYLRV